MVRDEDLTKIFSFKDWGPCFPLDGRGVGCLSWVAIVSSEHRVTGLRILFQSIESFSLRQIREVKIKIISYYKKRLEVLLKNILKKI